MIGVSTPEYQLSIGNGGEFVNKLESAVLNSGNIVSVYLRGSLGLVVQMFDPATGTSTNKAIVTASGITPTSWGIQNCDVVALSGGGFVVFGSTVDTMNNRTPVLWRFDANGVQQGSVQTILSAAADNATMHRTANGFIITYSDRTSGSDKGYIQAFDATGAAVGGPQLISNVVLAKEIDVVTLANGKMALAWAGTSGVYLSELNANGVLTGTTAVVDSSVSAPFGWSLGPKVVAEGNGFLTLHIDQGGLVMTRFDANFVQQGGAMPVLGGYPGSGAQDGYIKFNQNEPVHDIAVLRNGVIVVAWSGYDTGSTTTANVFVQYLAPDGSALTDPIIANARIPEDQTAISLLTTANGRIFLAFKDDTNIPFGGSQAQAQGVWLDGPDGYYVGTANADAASGIAGDDAMRGNAGNDTLNGLGGDDQVSGWEGDDSLLGGGGQDQVNGGDGNDRLFGEASNDILLGGLGDDAGYGGDGNDTISGQDGNDSLLGDANIDVIYGGAGDDTANGGSGADRLEGGDGNDRLIGGTANDSLLGQNGNDVLDGVDNDDSLDGGAGNDRLLGQGGADKLYGGSDHDREYGGGGNDIVNGGDGNDLLLGEGGDDILAGQRGVDTLDGGIGNDVLFAGQDNDTLTGGDGNDTLCAASGNDRLTGNAGADLFDFGFTFSEGAIGKDLITDFTVGVDKIGLQGWGLVLGGTLTLEARSNGCALVTATGDEIMIRGVTVAQFDTNDLLL